MGIVLAAIAAPALLVLTVFLVAVCCFRSGSGKSSRSAVGTVDEQSPLLIAADRQEAEDELASQERGQAGHEPERQDSRPPTHASSERDSTQRHGDSINVRTSQLDAHQVCAALWEARAKWYAIGVELQIDSFELDSIQRRNDNDSDKCITEMTDLWLRQSTDPRSTTVAATWENLAVALRQPTVGCGELADSIMVNQLGTDGGGSSSGGASGHGVTTRVGDHGSHHATNVPSSGRRVRVHPSAGVATPLILLGTGGRWSSRADSTVKTKSDSVVNLSQDSPFDEPISPASIQGLRKPKGPKGRRLPSRRKKKEGQQPLLE